jgi:glycosyltransferase involved in cell wall biosynthesis
VVPSYRRLARLPDLVRAYRAQGADQIVVVLDGPHPEWQKTLAPSGGSDLTISALPENVGLARARIAGLRVATGDIVLAVDDDVEPAAGLVERHRRFHEAHPDSVLQGYMPTALPSPRGRDQSPTFLYAREYEAQTGVWRAGRSALLLRSLWGGNFSLPRRLYERAETLLPSVRLEYNEDLDLGLRLELLGASAAFDPEARATHHHSRGLVAFLRESVARGEAIAHIEERWGERPAQLTPIVDIPPSYNRVLGALQRRIAARDEPGFLEGGIVLAYRAAAVAHAWKLQDGISRMLRRAMAMRGYRLAQQRQRARAAARV